MFANLSASLSEGLNARPRVETLCSPSALFHGVRDPSENQLNPQSKEMNYDVG